MGHLKPKNIEIPKKKKSVYFKYFAQVQGSGGGAGGGVCFTVELEERSSQSLFL